MNRSKIKTSNTKVYNKHLGNATALLSDGANFNACIKPSCEELATFGYLAEREPIIKSGLNFITLAIANKFGQYNHPNPKIQSFVQKVLKKRLVNWLEPCIFSALWSGWSLGEIVYQPKKFNIGGKVEDFISIKDIYFYPSISTYFVLNDHGVLTHGEKVYDDLFLTGAWVPAPPYQEKMPNTENYSGSHIRLEEDTILHLTFGLQPSTNPYGGSQLKSVSKYPFFKEVIDNQFITALDRYGTPLTAIIVPEAEVDEIVVEADGTERPKSYFEAVSEGIIDMNQNSENPYFVLENAASDKEIKITPLTTGNNYADAFISGLDYYESQILRGLGVPNLLFKDNNSKLGSGGSSERQMETFIMLMSSFFKKASNSFLESVIKNLIKYNFGDPDIIEGDIGEFTELPLRVADLKDLATTVKILKESEVFDSSDPSQLNHYRNMFSIPYNK